MSEHSIYKISELSTLLKRGVTPSYTEKKEVLVVNQKCIRDFKLNLNLARYTNPKKKKINQEKFLKSFDILINSTGVGTLGRVAQIGEIKNSITADSHITIMRPNQDLVDPEYLGYSIKAIQKVIENLGEGSTGQTELSRTILGDLELKILSGKKYQKKVAVFFANIDKKIELNQKMNQTLEEIAKTLFKSWFVDFDPVRAKVEGRSTGLSKEISNLFPDSFKKTEFGNIPNGWTQKKIGDTLEFVYGTALVKKNRKKGKIPVYGSNGIVGYHDKFNSIGPGIVIGRAGNPGTVHWSFDNFFIIDSAFSVKILENIKSNFFYYVLKNAKLELLNSGSAIPGLNRHSAYARKFIFPPKDLINCFNNISADIFNKIFHNNKENKILSNLRDTLLPKLISGKVKIPEAEDFVGEASA